MHGRFPCLFNHPVARFPQIRGLPSDVRKHEQRAILGHTMFPEVEVHAFDLCSLLTATEFGDCTCKGRRAPRV